MRKYIIIILCLFIITGCSNNIEKSKKEYLTLKNTLLNQRVFTESSYLPFDINFVLDKLTEDEIRYKAVIDNPKTILTDIKALLVHNKETEDIFPSIGIFDDPVTLNPEIKEEKGLILVGYIHTTKEIEDFNVKLKLAIEYKIDGETKKAYYESTN